MAIPDFTPNTQQWGAMAGAGNRMVQVDPNGNGTATQPIITGKLSDATAINLLINVANWDANNAYIGTAITGTYEGQYYSDSDFFFTAYSDNAWKRILLDVIPNLRLTSQKVWMGNGSNVPTETDTESSALTVGNYTVDFPELAEESNWVDNVTNAISGVIGDRAVGIDELGSISESMYTQYGWTRDFINSFITDATLIAALQTSGNWTKVTDVISTYNAAKGDRNQTYYNNGYFYFCYGTSSHTWLRYGNLDTITTTDINYLPKPQIEVGKGHGDYLIIDAKYDITNIIVEAETTTAGNLTIGSTGTQEIASLAVTAACSTNGNAQVVLDGVTFNVPLTTAQNSTTLVATALRAFSYTGWATGGTGTTVTFTCNKYKTCTDATYSDNGTGATGTMTTGTQGVDPNNDIITSIALPTTIGQKKRLTYLVNVDFPTASNRNMYINISSAATIKLHIIIQKYFE